MSFVPALSFCLLPFAFPSFTVQCLQLASQSPGRVEVLQSVDALPAGYRRPVPRARWASRRVPDGPYYVFDRRGHSVHTVDEHGRSVRTLVEIGGEEGRLLDPSAFDVAADGSFAVADAPGGRERVQVFGAAGIRIGGFTRPGRTAARVALGIAGAERRRQPRLHRPLGRAQRARHRMAADGIHDRSATPIRSIGRAPADRPGGRPRGPPRAQRRPGAARAFGRLLLRVPRRHPAIRKYSASGALLFERAIQGRELDRPAGGACRSGGRAAPSAIARCRSCRPWSAPRPSIRDGRLWVSFVLPYTYVFDAEGEKIRTVQFRAAGRRGRHEPGLPGLEPGARSPLAATSSRSD